MKSCKLWIGLLAFCVAISPVMKYIWIHAISGNANFLFNQQLIFALSAGSLTAEFVAAGVRVMKRDGKTTTTSPSAEARARTGKQRTE